MTTAHRLNRGGGEVRSVSLDLLAALCDVLGVEPGELFARADAPPQTEGDRRPPPPSSKRRTAQ